MNVLFAEQRLWLFLQGFGFSASHLSQVRQALGRRLLLFWRRSGDASEFIPACLARLDNIDGVLNFFEFTLDIHRFVLLLPFMAFLIFLITFLTSLRTTSS